MVILCVYYCRIMGYLHKVQIFTNGLASCDFGLRCNRFPYMSLYTIFFKCTNSDATCMDPFKSVRTTGLL